MLKYNHTLLAYQWPTLVTSTGPIAEEGNETCPLRKKGEKCRGKWKGEEGDGEVGRKRGKGEEGKVVGGGAYVARLNFKTGLFAY